MRPPCQHALLGPGRGRDLDAIPRVVLHEDVDQAPVGAALFRIEHRLAVGVGAEGAGRQLAELGVAQAAAAQLLRAVARIGTDHEGEPGERGRDRQRERVHRQVEPLRSDAAGPDGRHLALVVEAAEGEHRGEQHADRHQHDEVLEGREPDQREHDVVRKAALRGDPEDARELVAHEDREQHDGHAGKGGRDFAQDVAVDGGKQGQFCAVSGTFSIKLGGTR